MYDENESLPGETSEPAPQENETETLPTDNGSLIQGTDPTEEVQTITIQEIQEIGSDIAHVNLFGSFLVCGTLIGLALWRKFNGI